MLNHVTIMGRLTDDPELRFTQNDVSVTSFRLAVERDYANQDGERETDFYDITAWRGTAEFICNYFAKGRMIALDGRLTTQSWEDRDGNNRVSVIIVAESAYFADSKRKEEEEKPARGRSASKTTGKSKAQSSSRSGSRSRRAA